MLFYFQCRADLRLIFEVLRGSEKHGAPPWREQIQGSCGSDGPDKHNLCRWPSCDARPCWDVASAHEADQSVTHGVGKMPF